MTDVDFSEPLEMVASCPDSHALAGLLRDRFPGMLVAERCGALFALMPMGLVFDVDRLMRDLDPELEGVAWDYCTPDWEDFLPRKDA